MNFFLILLFCINSVTCALAYFEEYNACHAYKNGDNACAQKLYDELLTRRPDNASAAYNCGKIALKEKEFEKAEAYFNHVTKNAAAPNALREQAWYDAGLSFVHRELWQDALNSFQEVLKINPDNEYAKKMIEQIQKKLDEQKQQEEQQKNDEQSCDDEKKDNNDDSQKNDQNDSQSDEHEKNDDQKDSEEQKSDEQSQNSDNRDPNDQSSENAPQQDQHERNNNQNNPQPQQNKQEEQQQQSEQPKPQQSERQESAADDQHGKNASSKPQQAQEQKELPDAKKAGTYGNQKPQDKESKLLELVEQHDAQASKALFKRQIQQQMPSYYGQKNW